VSQALSGILYNYIEETHYRIPSTCTLSTLISVTIHHLHFVTVPDAAAAWTPCVRTSLPSCQGQQLRSLAVLRKVATYDDSTCIDCYHNEEITSYSFTTAAGQSNIFPP
jgi:hypothetical protein